MSDAVHPFAADDFCYLTTSGRRSGRLHTIEIWFALSGNTLYLLSGGRDRSDWVKNIVVHPEVQVKIREKSFTGQARVVSDQQEEARARKLVYEKYTPRDSDDLTDWARTSLPVAIDVVM